MFKAVVDTNQFVSALISKSGPSARLLDAWRNRLFLLILSREIMKEIKAVLHYPRIRQKYKFPPEDIESLLHLLEHEAIILHEVVGLAVIKADPDDDKILACAVTASADYIVSGDKHLLDLRQYQRIPIVAVGEFLKLLKV